MSWIVAHWSTLVMIGMFVVTLVAIADSLLVRLAARERELGHVDRAVRLEALETKLRYAHESLDVFGRVVQRVEGGEAIAQAVLEEEQSGESQDLIGLFLSKDRTGGSS